MSIKLLLIDDEIDLLEALKDLLTSDNCQVVTCSTPLMAYEECMRDRFDLILSDHNMKDLNGLELLKVLRADGNMTPFVLLTGCASKEIAITALRLGASDVLEKPMDTHGIQISIARTLELEKGRALFYKTSENKGFSSRLGNLLAATKIEKVS